MKEDCIVGRLNLIHVQVDLGTTLANLARTEYRLETASMPTPLSPRPGWPMGTRASGHGERRLWASMLATSCAMDRLERLIGVVHSEA